MASAAPARLRHHKPLSFNERRVLVCMCAGLNCIQIAEVLGKARGTIQSLQFRMRQKLGVTGMDRVEIAINLNAAVRHAFMHPGPRQLRELPDEFDDHNPTPEGAD